MAVALEASVDQLTRLAGGSDEERRQAVWDAIPAQTRPTAPRLQGVIAVRKSDPGRARMSLVAQLYHHGRRDEPPSPIALRTWLLVASTRLDIEPIRLLNHWRPLIREREVFRDAAGTLSGDELCARVLLLADEEIAEMDERARSRRQKPANELRHRVIEEVRLTLPTRQDGGAVRGFWPACVRTCHEAGDDIEGLDERHRADDLERWYRQHCREHCELLDDL